MFKNLEKPPSITITPFGNGDIRDSKWIDGEGIGEGEGLVGGVRFHCRAFSAKYRAVNILLFISLSSFLRISLYRFHRFFPRVVFRCFKLSATPACIRVLPLASRWVSRSIVGKKSGEKS